MPDLEALRADLKTALLSLDRIAAGSIVSEAVSARSAQYAAETVVGGALTEIGQMWEEGKAALSQIYMSGRICEELIETYLPPSAQLQQTQPKIAIAVLDDYHLLGKRIVYSILRASGVAIEDYGRMTAGEVVARVTRDGVDLLLLSVLMLPSALQVREVKAGLARSHPGTRIVVGGAPFRFDDRLWREVGADAFGWNASDAIKIVKDIAS